MQTFLFLIFALIIQVLAENYVREDNLSPDEAQKYIEQQSLDLRYANFLGEHQIPYLRSGEAPRQYWYNGRMIENPEEFVEEEYLANQFHGQDGLGRALFGYTDHNQARVEAINGNGDVRGSYKYINPNGEEFEVKYWADSLGFHQTDNRPEVKLEPVSETPEVRQAREEHERAWKEAAAAATGQDPLSDYYNRFAIANDEERSRLEQTEELMNQQQQQQGQDRYPNLPYSQHINSNTKIQGQFATKDSVVTNAQGRQYDDGQWHPENEGQGDPHGFFYSFDYPVSLIVPTNARSLKKPGQK